QRDAVGICLIPESPPAPVHVQNRSQVVMTQMCGAGRGIVHEVPTSGAEPDGKIWVFTTDAERFIVPAGFQNGGLAEYVVAAIEEARIADVLWTPTLSHAGATPTICQCRLHALDEDAASARHLRIVQMRKEGGNPARIGNHICVHRSHKLVASGAQR